MEKFIPYGHQWIDDDDINEVIKTLKSDWITQGPKVEEFEKAVAQYCFSKYGLAFSSGSVALKAAYNIAEIGSGDEVITTPLTFAATVYNIIHLGAKPVFIDIKEDTLNIDPKGIERKIKEKTKCIVSVDFAGQACDYEEILEIKKKHNLLLIEDACHALGASYKGKRIGSLADMTVFSFHPVKTITTGEGGMVLTNNESFYNKLKLFRNHGIIKKPEKGSWYYEIEEPSLNYRITDIQCALGLSQLKKLEKFIKRRKEIAAMYNKAFKEFEEVSLPNDNAESSWHIYVIQVSAERRENIFNKLREEGIGVQVHYMPIHMHPFYKNKFGEQSFPKAENYYKRAITLPLFPKMTDDEVSRVINTFKKIYYEL